ncbi:MAG: hypothetical protein EP333_09825 [Bacteroidetes bacterium]|nr:MAG: hypothetical protein EP333_09825 [Bacteroidota bacterium]
MNNDRDHIDKRILESFKEQKRKAPEHLWEEVAAANQLSGDEGRIRESFNGVNTQKAPVSSWTNIKRQLIIDDVWTNILTYQKKRKKRLIVWWWTGSVASVIVFALISGFLVNKEVEQKNSNLPENRVELYLKRLNHYSKKSNEYVEPTDKIPGFSRQYVSGAFTTLSETNIDNSINENKKANINAFSYENAQLKNESRSVISISETNKHVTVKNHFSKGEINTLETKAFEETTKELLQREFQEKVEFRRLELGAHFAVGNTWILNNDVKRGFNSNSLIKDRFSIGHSLGAEIIYKFNHRLALYASYDFHSIVRQNYDFYQSGSLYNRRIKLSQQKVLSGMKFCFDDKVLNKRNFVLRTGVFLAHSIDEEVTTNSENKLTGFEQIDFGITIGFGTEKKLGLLIAEYGIRSDIGCYNLASDTPELPKKFD